MMRFFKQWVDAAKRKAPPPPPELGESEIEAWLRHYHEQPLQDWTLLRLQLESAFTELLSSDFLNQDGESKKILLKITQTESIEEIDKDMDLLKERTLARLALIEAKKKQQEEAQTSQMPSHPPRREAGASLQPPPSPTLPMGEKEPVSVLNRAGVQQFAAHGKDEEEEEGSRAFIRL